MDGGTEGEGRRLYGISEIAAALGVTPRLVASWRQRGSHGLPEPDANLASGAVWFAETIEPWLARYKTGREPDARAAAEAVIRKVARRSYRLATVVNEEPPIREDAVARRLDELSRAAEEMREFMRDLRPSVLGGSALKLLHSVDSAISHITGRPVGPDVMGESSGLDLGEEGELARMRALVSAELLPSVTRLLQILDRTPQHWRREVPE